MTEPILITGSIQIPKAVWSNSRGSQHHFSEEKTLGLGLRMSTLMGSSGTGEVQLQTPRKKGISMMTTY